MPAISKPSSCERAREYGELDEGLRVRREPRPFQSEALAAWRRARGQGVVVLPTGAGKTCVAQLAIDAGRRHTLVVAPTLGRSRSSGFAGRRRIVGIVLAAPATRQAPSTSARARAPRSGTAGTSIATRLRGIRTLLRPMKGTPSISESRRVFRRARIARVPRAHETFRKHSSRSTLVGCCPW